MLLQFNPQIDDRANVWLLALTRAPFDPVGPLMPTTYFAVVRSRGVEALIICVADRCSDGSRQTGVSSRRSPPRPVPRDCAIISETYA